MRRTLSLMLVLLLALTPCFARAETLADEITETVRVTKLTRFVQSAFDGVSDLYYEYDEESDSFSLLFGSSSEVMGDLYTYVDVYSEGLLITACYETDAPQEAINEIVRFANMRNADMLCGKYYVFPDTGSICYEDFIDFGLVDLNTLDEEAQNILHGYLSGLLLRADYDAEYFAELISGLSAENAYAIYLADTQD